MTMQSNLVAIFATCFLLGGCADNAPEPDSQSKTSENSTSEAYNVINGFYRSGIVVTQVDGTVSKDIKTELDTDNRTLSFFEGTADSMERLSPVPGTLTSYGYDENGYLISLSIEKDGVFFEEREHNYDEKGILTSVTIARIPDAPWWEEKFFYNDAGQLTSRIGSPIDETMVGGSERIIFTYDTSARLESVSKGNPSINAPFVKTSFSYDDENRIIESQYDYDSDGAIEFRREFTYDANGNVSQITLYGSDGTMGSVTTYTYTATDELVFNKSLFDLSYDPSVF